MRGNSVTIFDCRPPWPEDNTEWSRQPLAQLRFSPEASGWTLHWADRNSRWHLYDLIAANQPVGELLSEIDRDPTCIFWG